MSCAELTKTINDKKRERLDLRKKGQNAKTIKELDSIEMDLRKLDIDIKELEEELHEEVSKRSYKNNSPVGELGVPGSFNPLATYRTYNDPVNRNDIFGGIALRSEEKLEDKINATKEERALDLGKYIKGIATGKWTGAESEKRAMMTSGVGTVIPQVLSARIIDYARNISAFGDAGVPLVPMDTGNLTIAKVKSDPEFKFKEEGAEAEESSFELGTVDLKAKTCYGYAYVSLEAINSSPNLAHIIQKTFGAAIANAIDKAILYGQSETGVEPFDTFAPSGILNDKSINIIEAKSEPAYHSLLKARAEIKKANGNPTSYIINADTEMYLDLYTDSIGQYQSRPVALDTLKRQVSNQMKYDKAEGSEAIVFDKEALVIGMQKQINIEMFRNSDECIKKGLVGFRIYAMLDCAVTQPKHITKITGINKQQATSWSIETRGD